MLHNIGKHWNRSPLPPAAGREAGSKRICNVLIALSLLRTLAAFLVCVARFPQENHRRARITRLQILFEYLPCAIYCIFLMHYMDSHIIIEWQRESVVLECITLGTEDRRIKSAMIFVLYLLVVASGMSRWEHLEISYFA